MSVIDDKYSQVGGQRILGAPSGPEEQTPDGSGLIRYYQSGCIVWHPATGAHEVHGAISLKWRELGGLAGRLGYPLSDESDGRAGGKFNHFVNGSIYWTGQLGAHPIAKPVFDKWQSMGWETSVGFPVGDPIDVGDGTRRQVFERAIFRWGPQQGVELITRPQPRRRQARIFLVSWADFPPPPNYTRQFFENYFFGTGVAFENPDGNMIPGSIADYFSHVSDGYLTLGGHVGDWVQSPLRIRDLPHWFDGVQFPANTLRAYGGTLIEALRGSGIRSREHLMVDGVMPDVIAFVGLDVWGGGGAARTLWDVKQDVQQSGRIDLWDSAWESFADIPLMFFSACSEVPDPGNRTDGTILPAQPEAEIRWAQVSAPVHEFVHTLFEMAWDVYGGAWDFNTWFEVMGYSHGTDYPVLMTSFVQERCGLLSIEDLPRRPHRELLVDPLDSHSVAFRLQNGPLRNAETLVIENRSRWNYAENPPPRLSNVLLAYTLDTQSRRSLPDGTRFTAGQIRHSGEWDESWGVPGHVDLSRSGPRLGNSLNALGEGWWELNNIRVNDDNTIVVDVLYRPTDLIRQYTTATWTNSQAASLKPDVFGGPSGHVMLVGRSRAIDDGERYDRVLSLHPDWVQNGAIIGDYDVAVPASGGRLYLTCALSEEAVGSNGVGCSVQVDGVPRVATSLTLERNIRTLVVPLPGVTDGSTTRVTVTFRAGSSAVRDWAYIPEAAIVPTAHTLADFLSIAPSGTFRGESEVLVLDDPPADRGGAQLLRQEAMQDGSIHGGPVLALTCPAVDNSRVEARFPFVVPEGNSVVRAQAGFPESRSLVDDGATVSILFTESFGQETVLLTNARVRRAPAFGEVGVDANALMAMAILMPDDLRGRSGELVFRVHAAGSASQDTVVWTMARVTSD